MNNFRSELQLRKEAGISCPGSILASQNKHCYPLIEYNLPFMSHFVVFCRILSHQRANN